MEFENGDYIYYKNKWGTYFNAHFYLEGVYDAGFINYDLNPFRLHTQNQLQEILIDNKLKGYGAYSELILRFATWVEENCNIKSWNWSMEQLWLVFTKKEKYNKTWNGEEWICINQSS